MIVSRVLYQQQQQYGKGTGSNRLVVPGELRLEKVHVPVLDAKYKEEYHICMSRHDKASAPLLAEIMEETTQTRPTPCKVARHHCCQESDTTKSKPQLRVGILGEGGCTLENSTNLALILGTDALLNKQVVADVRDALLRGLNVITLHNKGARIRSHHFFSC
jgi:hypothetical protein